MPQRVSLAVATMPTCFPELFANSYFAEPTPPSRAARFLCEGVQWRKRIVNETDIGFSRYRYPLWYRYPTGRVITYRRGGRVLYRALRVR